MGRANDDKMIGGSQFVFALFIALFALYTPEAYPASWSPVPVPSETVTIDVREGEIHPFPWPPQQSCRKASEPGCFKVEKVNPEQVILRFTRFEIEEGKVVSGRFGYRTPVTKEGSEYELYTVKLGGIREEWIYAALEKSSAASARITFLKYPAFVAEKARVLVAIQLDFAAGRLIETHRVEAQEPITLIGLSSLPSSIAPFSKIESVNVNGEPVSFPYAKIMNLNLPPGTNVVTVNVALGSQIRNLTLQGTLFEPRKMALVDEVDLRTFLPPQAQGGPSVELTTVGLPKSVWEEFRSRMFVEPTPLSSAAPGLSVIYHFPPTKEIRVKTRPRVPHGKANYPVMISVGIQDPK